MGNIQHVAFTSTSSTAYRVPDVAGMVSSGIVTSLQPQQQQQPGQQGLSGILGGLLGKKKK